MTAEPLTLFAGCPVPGCTALSGDGEPCPECEALIGAGLIRETIREVVAEIVAERPGEATPLLLGIAAGNRRAAAQERGEAYKPGQWCWVCEERRACRIDPDFPGAADRWICRDCEAIQ